MHILLTRPIEDCKDLIIKFKNLGHVVSHMPVIKIEKLNYEIGPRRKGFGKSGISLDHLVIVEALLLNILATSFLLI